MKTDRTIRLVARLALVLALAMIVLVLVSWLLSATTGDNVRSLLSSEGIRFFVGSFVDMLQQPLLVWIVLLAMAWGCFRESGVCSLFTSRPRYQQRQAVLLMAILLVSYVAVVLLLTLTPHAVLLSATGQLWPSAFSRALVPLVTFGVIMLSAAYGLFSRNFLSLADVCQALTSGIASAAPLLFLYVLAVQFFESLRFVFA